MKVVLRIREAIALKGYSQREVARRLNMRPNTINKVANGDINKIDLELLARIAEVLEITDLKELMYLE